MPKDAKTIALECLLDLGVTVVYAVFIGMLIVAIVASDAGPISLPKTVLYVGLLPASVLALIAVDFAMRLLAERREATRRRVLHAATALPLDLARTPYALNRAR